MVETAEVMRGISTGISTSGSTDEVDDALHDVDGLVTDALQIGIDLEHSEDETQVAGHGLLHGQQVQRPVRRWRAPGR